MQLSYIIQKSRRRTISISILSDNRILVKAPYGTPEYTVKEFLLSKEKWITKHIERQAAEVQKAEALGILSENEIRQIKKQAKKIIPERVAYWSEKLGVTYGRISIRLQSSRWGSCSQTGNLNFNCLLVIMPKDIMDSVVVHELCHRRHMNHSKAFYKEVYSVFPDYERCNKWLNENGGVYMKRVSAV